jgi:choline-glycine betaine transporter
MSFKKIIVAISLPLFLTCVLSSQSLVDLAKKEKERREKLKNQEKTVVTNADLSNIKRGPRRKRNGRIFI